MLLHFYFLQQHLKIIRIILFSFYKKFFRKFFQVEPLFIKCHIVTNFSFRKCFQTIGTDEFCFDRRFKHIIGINPFQIVSGADKSFRLDNKPVFSVKTAGNTVFSRMTTARRTMNSSYTADFLYIIKFNLTPSGTVCGLRHGEVYNIQQHICRLFCRNNFHRKYVT